MTPYYVVHMNGGIIVWKDMFLLYDYEKLKMDWDCMLLNYSSNTLM